jgi:hypothetical protein
MVNEWIIWYTNRLSAFEWEWITIHLKYTKFVIKVQREGKCTQKKKTLYKNVCESQNSHN